MNMFYGKINLETAKKNQLFHAFCHIILLQRPTLGHFILSCVSSLYRAATADRLHILLRDVYLKKLYLFIFPYFSERKIRKRKVKQNQKRYLERMWKRRWTSNVHEPQNNYLGENLKMYLYCSLFKWFHIFMFVDDLLLIGIWIRPWKLRKLWRR